MVVGTLMVFVGIIAILVVFLLTLRSWTLAGAKTEAHLRAPDTHTVAYAIPEGQDPAILMAAMTHAGFTSMVDTRGEREQLLVECAESDRARVRSVLERVDRAGFDGPEMRIGRITFEDER